MWDALGSIPKCFFHWVWWCTAVPAVEEAGRYRVQSHLGLGNESTTSWDYEAISERRRKGKEKGMKRRMKVGKKTFYVG